MVDIVPSLNDKQDLTQARLDSGPGQQLADARQKAGLSVESVAENLHIAPLVVERLERDDYQSLPPATFVRGYLRNYARLLGLDAEKILALHTRVTGGVAAREMPLKRMGRADAHTAVKKGGMWKTLLLIVILVGAIYWVWGHWGAVLYDLLLEATSGSSNVEHPLSLQDGGRVSHADLIPTEEDRVVPRVSGSGAVSLPADQSTSLESSTSALDPDPVREMESEPPLDPEEEMETDDLPDEAEGEGVSVSGGGMETSQAVLPTPSDLGRSTLVLKFTGRSWVRVVDAQGKRLIGGEVSAPSVRELVGVPPFSVRLGNSGAVEIEHNGMPVEFSPRKTGVVAEFVVDTALSAR
jgi:cytoskeleton protein RodZ